MAQTILTSRAVSGSAWSGLRGVADYISFHEACQHRGREAARGSRGEHEDEQDVRKAFGSDEIW